MPESQKERNTRLLFECYHVINKANVFIMRHLLLEGFVERQKTLSEILADGVVSLSINNSFEQYYVRLFDRVVNQAIDRHGINTFRFQIREDQSPICRELSTLHAELEDQRSLGDIVRLLNVQLAVRNAHPLTSLDIAFLDRYMKQKSVFGVRLSQICDRSNTDLLDDELDEIVPCVFEKLGGRSSLGLLAREQVEHMEHDHGWDQGFPMPLQRLDYEPWQEEPDRGQCLIPQLQKELRNVSDPVIFWDGSTREDVVTTNLLESRSFVENNIEELDRLAEIDKVHDYGFYDLSTDYYAEQQLSDLKLPQIQKINHSVADSVCCLMSPYHKGFRHLERLERRNREVGGELVTGSERNLVSSIREDLRLQNSETINLESVIEIQVESLSRSEFLQALSVDEKAICKLQSRQLLERPASPQPLYPGWKHTLLKTVTVAVPTAIIVACKERPSYYYSRGVLASVTTTHSSYHCSTLPVGSWVSVLLSVLCLILWRFFCWLRMQIFLAIKAMKKTNVKTPS